MKKDTLINNVLDEIVKEKDIVIQQKDILIQLLRNNIKSIKDTLTELTGKVNKQVDDLLINELWS